VKVAQAIPAGWGSFFAPDFPRIGMGLDVGTTTKLKSNPSVLAVTQQVGVSYFVRLLVSWKAKDPAVCRAILDIVLQGLPFGYRARRLCIDATSERYFAADLRRDFANKVPVELVVASEGTEYLGEKMNFKQYTGNLLVNTLDDGYVAIPNEPWIQRDLRSVFRDRGTFEAEIDEEGRHGDCFDAIKLSLHALIAKGGPTQAAGVRVGSAGISMKPRDRFPMRAEEQDDAKSGGMGMP
jgi:hypothetical protein